MKMRVLWLPMILLIALGTGCNRKENTPRAKHVILIGLDGMGTYGFQRAHTPRMNEMAREGALSVSSRCIRETSSSQNWMTMLSGAIPEQHGVTSNDWEPDNHQIEPILKNKVGFFPSIFDLIKTQKPESKVYMFYEWGGLGRMFDLKTPDKAVLINNGEKTINAAIDAFFADKPDFLFVDVDETDHAGHTYGHESKGYFDCISKYDSIIGALTDRLKKENLLSETVIIVCGDHGGIGKGHGGDTPNELEMAFLLYGGNVTKGQVMEHSALIADIAPTVAGLLGVTMPRECVGKFLSEAFEPKNNAQYVPMPLVQPSSGFFSDAVSVTITADWPETKIYYTTDGSEPTNASTLYEKPVTMTQNTVLKAISYVGNAHGKIVSNSYRIAGKSVPSTVKYQLFNQISGNKLPDFSHLGKPAKQGLAHEFSLTEMNLPDQDHFAVLFTASLEIDQPDEYWFCLSSDDGSKLYIDNQLVVDNDGSHSNLMKKGKIKLDKGIHPIKIEYFDDTSGEFIELSYQSASVPFQVVPFSKLK